MIARIEFDYSARQQMAKLATEDERRERARAVFLSVFGKLPPEERIGETWAWGSEARIDLEEEGKTLIDLGVAFTVKGMGGCLPLEALLPGGAAYTVYVQVPHVGLLSINEVRVIENACTDSLQTELDKGWRILCVCPPNAARRPDYILGRAAEVGR